MNVGRNLLFLFSGKDLGASLTIVLLLSLGLGAATLLYTALDRLLLHPLDVSHPETLVRAVERHPPILSFEWFRYSAYQSMRQMHSFEDLAVEGNFDTVVQISGRVQPAIAEMVSGSYFSIFGVTAEIGRTLDPADEQSRSGTVPVVLSNRFWQREFAKSSSIIGSTLSIHGQPFTVVGVAPKRFYGSKLDSSPDFWLPLAAQPLLSTKSLNDAEPDRNFSIIGRLKKGTTLAQAQAEFSAIYPAIKQADHDGDPKREGLIVPVATGAFALRDQFGHALTLLLWGLATLLMMVCANVAGLQLARQTRKERDTAVRIALGASRARLVATALLQSATLGFAGACGGILVGYLCAPLLLRLLPAGKTPLPVSLTPDWKIDLLAVLLALAVSVIFGLLPALVASRVDPQQALRRGSATRRPSVMSQALLSFQTGATLVLLVGTGLLIHTFVILKNTSPGFDVEHLIAFTLDPQLLGQSGSQAASLSPSLPAELQQRIQSLPGVRSASIANAPLMQRIGMKTTVAIPGQKIPSGAFLNTSLDSVSSTFFETMQIPILSGRSFSSAESTHSGPAPTVINEAFARLIFPNQDPLGKTFGMGTPGDTAKATNIVVGIAGDSKYRSLREALLPIYYAPIDPKLSIDSQLYIYVRTQASPESIVPAARQVLSNLNAGLAFSDVSTMRQQVDESLWQERMLAALAGTFSVISILMAATGLYGLLSYDATQRTREFGIRSAVGAQRKDVAILLIRGLLRIVAPGLAVGLLGCLLLARVIASALYGIKPLDPVSFSAALAAVILICAVAAWQPVRRAMQVDPAIVLRDE